MTDVDVAQIGGYAKPVEEVLANKKYGLDFYQREYGWQESQVSELIDDLTVRFMDEYEETHSRPDVASYRPYFLGPIVTAQRDGTRYLVDGQQRLTTLALLLIYLRSRLGASSDEGKELDSLIYSSSYGRKSFNLDVPERAACMTAILDGGDFDTTDATESVRNLWDRYQDIVARFPDEITNGRSLPFFTDWLVNRVVFVDISAPDQDMALEIFETMNDRGLRLSNVDMLKSFLLARVEDPASIDDLNTSWRRRVTQLSELEKNADAEFVKAWLRGNYAQTIREGRKAATPGDFDIIGTAFHKWVRDNTSELGLNSKDDYKNLIGHDFLRLSGRYVELLEASHTLTVGLEPVFYNGITGFTLQLPVILAAVTPDDDDDEFRAKARAVAGALDIFVARRIVNFRNFGYSTVKNTMFNLMKRIRNRPLGDVRQELSNWLATESEQLDDMLSLRLHQRNRSHVKYLLARLTSWLDAEVGKDGTFAMYVDRSLKHPYEVEHIWANHFERHLAEFENEHDFSEQRNRLGALVLLPKDFNASFGDLAYKDKFDHYNSQNSLVRSLHPLAYQNNPSFVRLVESSGIDFRPFDGEFNAGSIDSRQQLYLEIARHLWDPSMIGLPDPEESALKQPPRSQSDSRDPDGSRAELHHSNVAIRESIARLASALEAHGLKDSDALEYVRLFAPENGCWAVVEMRSGRVVVVVSTAEPFDAQMAADKLIEDWNAKGRALYLTVSDRVHAYVLDAGAEDDAALAIVDLVPAILLAIEATAQARTAE